MNAKNIGILLLAGVALAGCGGGGGASGSTTTPATTPTPTVTISSSNQSAVANAALTTATQNIGSSYASNVGGVQTSSNSNNDHALFKTADFALQQMAQQQSQPASVGGVVTQTSCKAGGSYSFDTDGTSSSTATYWKATYNNCVYTAGTTYNGTIYITNVSHTPTGLTASMAFNFTITSNGSTMLSFVGGFDESATGIGSAARTDSLSGNSLVLSAGTSSFSLTNFSFVSTYNNDNTTPVTYNDNINYTVALADSANTANNFAFGFKTTPNNLIVKSSADMYPSSGQVVISGTNALRVTVLGGTGAGTSSGALTLEYSTDGGVTWGSPISKTWATL